MFTRFPIDARSKFAAILFSITLSMITVTGFVTGAMVPLSAAEASSPAVIRMPLA